MTKEFSMPTIPSVTKEHLDKIIGTDEVYEIAFETVRSLNIAILNVTSIIEKNEKFEASRTSLRNTLVLGFISKCIRLHSSILKLDSGGAHGESVEILTHQLIESAIKGLYFIQCDEKTVQDFVKHGLLPMSQAYNKISKKVELSPTEKHIENHYLDILSSLKLDKTDSFENDLSLPSTEEMIEILNLQKTFTEQMYQVTKTSSNVDITFITKSLLKYKDGLFHLASDEKKSAPFTIAGSCIVLCKLIEQYSEKFLTFDAVKSVLADYFKDYQEWLELFTSYTLSFYTTGMQKPKQEVAPPRFTRASKISEHKFQNKKLIPPLMTYGNVKLQSWSNDKMPEYIWVMLIIIKIGRDASIPFLKSISNFCLSIRIQTGKIGLSDISNLDSESKNKLLQFLTEKDEYKIALQPLLLIKSLPDYQSWQSFLEPISDEGSALQDLSNATASGLDQAGDDSAVCRWFSSFNMLLAGKINLASSEQYQRIFEYPLFGDRKMVESFIRSLDLATMGPEEKSIWIDIFWHDTFQLTRCIPSEMEIPTQVEKNIAISSSSLWHLYNLISDKYIEHLSTTKIDHKHDTLFGTTLYLVNLSTEILNSPQNSSLNVIALRTIAEGIINLKYLVFKNDTELWMKFRYYGVGQAKLNAMKLRELKDPPHFIPFADVENIANEDVREEYVVVEVGDWSKDSLRKRSEDCGEKEFYDRYYIWPSAFSHAQWPAIRYLVFENCYNPLHRLHRIPISPKNIITVKYDVEILLRKLIQILGSEIGDAQIEFENLIKSYVPMEE